MIPSILVSLPDGGVLVASPKTQVREKLIHRLWPNCGLVREAHSGAEALVRLERGNWDLLLLDRKLPDLDAEELAATIRQRFPRTRVVLLDASAGTDVTTAGPKIADRLVVGVQDDNLREDCERRNAEAASNTAPLPGMIGCSSAMREVYRLARLVAPRMTTVLLTGPSGTGKELVARGIHQVSPRASKPLVVVNCAAIPETLLESELFGHVRGAFTGAVQSQPGRIQSAQGGTLFLDEIAELPLSLQAKLLRFLELKEVQRLGCPGVSRVDVRIVAATNADLAERVAARQFRADLYFRLTTFPIHLPLLRQHPEDILPLARHFLEQEARQSGMRIPELGPEAEQILQLHGWEGNVRELQHMLERASILAEGEPRIRPEHLHFLPTQWAGLAEKNAPLGANSLELS